MPLFGKPKCAVISGGVCQSGVRVSERRGTGRDCPTGEMRSCSCIAGGQLRAPSSAGNSLKDIWLP